MGIGLSNYDFGAKGNWRRWAWNRAKERLAVPVKDAVVLYLPSRQNLDLKIATQKGFRPENMFGVERDKDIIKKLRRDGVNVIDGDFNNILVNWGKTPGIDVIIADFCGGLQKPFGSSATLYEALLISEGIKGFSTTIIANFLRGRDVFGGHLRKLLNGRSCLMCQNEDFAFEKLVKHRGFLFFWSYASILINEAGAPIESVMMPTGGSSFNSPALKPCFNSYKTKSNLHMDSVSFTVPGIKTSFSSWSRSAKQKIAAAKAIRTMRLAS